MPSDACRRLVRTAFTWRVSFPKRIEFCRTSVPMKQKYTLPSTASHSTRSVRIARICRNSSAVKFARNFRAGSAAGTRVIPVAAQRPARARARRIAAGTCGRPSKALNISPPAAPPPMMAVKVPSSRTPFPQESRDSGSSSGRRPYFDGPKSALWAPMRKTPAIAAGRLSRRKAARTNSITAISNTFTPRVTERLLKRSARCPPAIEKRMKGAEKRRNSIGTTASRCRAVAAAPSPTKVTRAFRALSEKAPWN